MAKSKRLKTEVSYFSTTPPFNKRHDEKLLKTYSSIFNNAVNFFSKERVRLPRTKEGDCSDEVAFQAFVHAFVDDYGVANLLAAIAANFHDRAEGRHFRACSLESDYGRQRADRHELIMWAHRIGAIAHEMHADDAKRDIVE